MKMDLKVGNGLCLWDRQLDLYASLWNLNPSDEMNL